MYTETLKSKLTSNSTCDVVSRSFKSANGRSTITENIVTENVTIDEDAIFNQNSSIYATKADMFTAIGNGEIVSVRVTQAGLDSNFATVVHKSSDKKSKPKTSKSKK